MADETAMIAYAPSPDLAAALPSLDPQAADIADFIGNWDQPATGHGADGRYLQAMEDVGTAKIWFDPLLYCFGQDDRWLLDYLPDMTHGNLVEPEGSHFNNLLASYERMRPRMFAGGNTDGASIPVQNLLMPLLLVKRRNPENARQNLLLLWKLQPWLAGHYLRWKTIPAIVMPDMSDYDIRNLQLHLRAQESAPNPEEIWRVVAAMWQDVKQGKIGANSPALPWIAGIAASLGCHRTYAYKLELALQHELTLQLLAENRLKIGAAVKVATALHAQPDAWNTAVQEIADKKMSQGAATRYLAKYARNRLAAIRLAGRADPIGDIYRHLAHALDIAADYPSAWEKMLGEEAGGSYDAIHRVCQIIQANRAAQDAAERAS